MIVRPGITIAMFSILAGATVRAQPRMPETVLATPAPVVAVMLARSGTLAAAVCDDHKLRLWDAHSARLIRTIDVAGRDVAMTAMTDDGHLMLLGDYHGDVTVWNTATGEVQLQLHLDRYLTAAAFSHDGRELALAPGTPVVLYEVTAKRARFELERTSGTSSIAFSRDDALVGTTDGDAVRIYDRRAGKLISRNGDFLAAPLAVDFLPDGKRAAAGGGDGVVVIAGTASGHTIHGAVRVHGAIFYLEASPNGQELAVVTQDANKPQLPAPVIFADLSSLQKKAQWMSPSAILLPGGATWTADGHFVVATSTASALHLWRIR